MLNIRGGALKNLLAAVLFIAAGCTSGGPQPTGASAPVSADTAVANDPEWPKIVDAAKKEGKLTIHAAFEQHLPDKYIPEFNKLYPATPADVVYGNEPATTEK